MYNKLFFDSSKNIVENAKELRQRQTKAEEILWQFLRNKNINGLKFRRQHYIKNYIAEYDEFRTKVLNELGITELRFTNEEIIENVTAVINKIKSELNKL